MSHQKNNHRRYNPLLDEWVIVAANRVSRPWQGASSDPPSFSSCSETNSLAPGGKRFGNLITPNYESTYVFDNDFPTFTEFSSEGEELDKEDDLFRKMEVRGVCRVLCYHPDTKQSIATMSLDEDYYLRHGRPLLSDVLQRERACPGERIVLDNKHWTVFVPYWAVWPYETMLLPNRHVLRIDELDQDEQIALADILRRLIIKYDNIFQVHPNLLQNKESLMWSNAHAIRCLVGICSSMGWLGAPTGPALKDDNQCWYLHVSFHPPLLRSATVPKYMAGYEVFSEPQRDITPEAAAATIRSQSEVHYTKNAD